MKTVLLNGTSYTFDPANNQIDFSPMGNFNSGRLYAVIDVTTGKLIYSVAAAAQGFGGSFSGDILTYASSNAGQSVSDSLMAIYDDPSAVQIISGNVALDPIPTQPIPTYNTTSTDVLGVLVSGNRNNQIEISFDSAPGATLITNTFTGSGSATVTNGHTIYATGTTGVSSAKGVSVQTTTYRPAHEVYCAFTAAFLNANANSYQRIGLFDANNGFYIGYEGTDFGITIRNGGVNTFIPQANFNIDTLTGQATSQFLRRDNPEAIDTTFSNLFRIRFAWLGSANILFEVLNPNGVWTLFHNVRQPNTNYNPSIQNPDLPMTVEVNKTAGANDVSIATACWGAGTTSNLSRVTDILTDRTLAALTRSVITGVTTGGGGGYHNVKVNPSGSLVTDASGSLVTLDDLIITGAATTTLGNNLLNAVAGTGATDCRYYRTAYVQVLSTATTGNITFEISNDNVNFQNINAVRQDRNDGFVTAGAVSLTSSSFIYAVPLTGRYLRCRISTAPGAGTLQAITRLSQSPHTMVALPVANLDPNNLTVSVTGATVRPTAPGTTTDIASGTLAASATTAALTPQSIYIQMQYAVSAVSGSGTLDVTIEESLDGGTSWNAIYSFPRITATGTFWSPMLRLRGRAYRYVQTLAGFTNVTRSATRIIRGDTCYSVASVIDRTIVPNTLNSTSASVYIANLRNINLSVRCTAQAGPATIALQFSDDNTNWFTSSTTLTTVNGVAMAKTTNEQWQYARAIVTVGGSGITLGELTIKGAEF
jgi:hypothetical protein